MTMKIKCDSCKEQDAEYQQNKYTELCLPCFFQTQRNQAAWNTEHPDEQILVWQYDKRKELEV